MSFLWVWYFRVQLYRTLQGVAVWMSKDCFEDLVINVGDEGAVGL